MLKMKLNTMHKNQHKHNKLHKKNTFTQIILLNRNQLVQEWT